MSELPERDATTDGSAPVVPDESDYIEVVVMDDLCDRAEADPSALRWWRAVVALGAAVLAIGWVVWPSLHLAQVERPLRYIAGSPYTFGFAVQCAAAGLLLTAKPPFPVYPAHTVGTLLIRGLSMAAVGLAIMETWFGDQPVAIGLIGWLEYPVVVLWIVMGFAYLGRLLRLESDARFANLADLAGVALVLLWVGSQLISGYPGLAMMGPVGVGMLVGLGVMIAVVVRYARPVYHLVFDEE